MRRCAISTSGANSRRATGLVVVLLVVLVAAPVWADDGDESAETDEETAEATEEAEEEEQAVSETRRLFALPTDSLEGETSEIVTERIDEAVRDRFATLQGVEMMPTFEALHGEATGEAATAAIAEAERQYTSGIGLVNAGEYDQAVDVLQRAVEVFEENVADLREFNLLVDAKANLAIAYHQSGFDLDARDTIEHYAQLEPDAELDTDDYPQELIDLYRDEVDRVESAGDGTVHIEADRDHAQVYIDGELKGETPLTVDDVGFGEHYLVVQDGDWRWSDIVQVRARGQEQDVEVELRDPDAEDDADDELPSFYVDLRQQLQTGQFGAGLDPYFHELAAQTGADFITWVIVVPTERSYTAVPFLYRSEDQTLMQGEPADFDMQLSNVRSRADALSDSIGVAFVHMPADRIVEEVDLIDEYRVEEPEEELVTEEELVAEEEIEEEVEEDPVADEDVDEPDEEVAVDDEQPDEELPVPEQEVATDEIEDPGPTTAPDDDGPDMMRYLGWGGAAAAATGAIAGTVFLLVRSGDDAGSGFEVEVEW